MKENRITHKLTSQLLVQTTEDDMMMMTILMGD